MAALLLMPKSALVSPLDLARRGVQPGRSCAAVASTNGQCSQNETLLQGA